MGIGLSLFDFNIKNGGKVYGENCKTSISGIFRKFCKS